MREAELLSSVVCFQGRGALLVISLAPRRIGTAGVPLSAGRLYPGIRIVSGGWFLRGKKLIIILKKIFGLLDTMTPFLNGGFPP
jgi:hypothetical protein